MVFRLWSYIGRRWGAWLTACEENRGPAPAPCEPFHEDRMRLRERAVAAIRAKSDSLALYEAIQARIAFLEEREQAALAAGDAEEAERRRTEAERHRADMPDLRRRHEEALARAEAVKAEIRQEEDRLRALAEGAQGRDPFTFIDRVSSADLWRGFLLALLAFALLLAAVVWFCWER